MLNRIGFSTLLSLTLMAGCAADMGRNTQSLDTGEAVDEEQQCSRVLGEYDGPNVAPPTISIPLGDNDVDAADVFEDARNNPNDLRAGLLAQFVTAQINIEAGATIDEFDIDLLVSAEEVLLTDGPSDGRRDQADLADLISGLAGLNAGMRLEVPCQANESGPVLEVDVEAAPPAPTRPTDRRDKGLFLGHADSAPTFTPPQAVPERPGSKL